MAENDYDFDNFLSDTTEPANSEEKPKKDNNRRSKKAQSRGKHGKNASVRIKARSGQTTPFAVQLHERDQEIIRAVCDTEGITQKRFFEYLIDGFLKGKKAQVRTAIENYRAKTQKYENSLLD
jgi:hypothetical protein